MHRSALLDQNFDHRSTKRYLPLNQRPQQNIDLPLNLKIIATLVPEPKTASTLPKCLKTCLNSLPNNARGAYYREEFNSDLCMDDLELYLNKGPVALKKFTLYVWHKKPQSHLPCWNTLIFHTHVSYSSISHTPVRYRIITT